MDKLETLRRLMNEGYELEDLDSDDHCVQARFHLNGRRATLRLFASDAERLLYKPARAGRVWIRR